MKITIYHNPACGTSRNTLAAIRAAGHEPEIVEYLKTPLRREAIKALIEQTGLTVREVARKKETLFHELRLDENNVTESELLGAMAEHPILINRPIVVMEDGERTIARLCRPSEIVREMLASMSQTSQVGGQ
jgi:arsenate reductase (glutaredoxin)